MCITTHHYFLQDYLKNFIYKNQIEIEEEMAQLHCAFATVDEEMLVKYKRHNSLSVMHTMKWTAFRKLVTNNLKKWYIN